MNALATRLVARARGFLAGLPGAQAFHCADSRTWTVLTISAASDESVFTLASLLGLGAVKERRAEMSNGGARWYLRAGAEQRERPGGVLVQIDVVGPAHIEGPKTKRGAS